MSKKKFSLDNALAGIQIDNNIDRDNIDKNKIKAINESELNKSSNTDDNLIINKKPDYHCDTRRQTYYMSEFLIESLNKLSEEIGYDKSYLVRMALAYFINNIQIEED